MSEAHEALSSYIDSSPTPWHAATNAAERLRGADFQQMDPRQEWKRVPDRGVVVRDGSLVAWAGAPGAAVAPIRLVGAHTDSPNLRIRPLPDTGRAGIRQLAVEVYGGALVNSWLDRDLVLAGRVAVSDPEVPGGVSHRLFHHRDPLLRVPQLAIHLDREVNEALTLNRQKHLTPVWGLGEPDEGGFRHFLAEEVGATAGEVLAWDVACADAAPPQVIGRHGEFLAAPRLDNLASCFAAVEALADAAGQGGPCVVVLYDHEEVGSTSATGAVGAWLAQVLERVAIAGGGDRSTLLSSLPSSMLLSADMAHATHPNYTDRHEPSHWVELGAGPVIKHNTNVRYATDSRGAAAFRAVASSVEVAVQDYSHRGDLPCGSTIGPLAAAGLALDTVDVGAPQLSMHSIRELMAVRDVEPMVRSFGAWLAGG